MKEAQAILFDLDGTLFDLNVPWHEVKSKMAAHYYRNYSQKIPDDKHFYSMFQFIEEQQGKEVLHYYLSFLENQELITIKEHFSKPRWLINEGLIRISQYIRYDTFFGIISSNFHASLLEILNQYGLIERFRVLIGRNDVKQSKPHPEGIIRVMDSYHLDPNKVLFVGDLPSDEEAANRAQIHFMYAKQMEEFLQEQEENN